MVQKIRIRPIGMASFAQQAYDAAEEPKELVWIEIHKHIELYDQDPSVSSP